MTSFNIHFLKNLEALRTPVTGHFQISPIFHKYCEYSINVNLIFFTTHSNQNSMSKPVGHNSSVQMKTWKAKSSKIVTKLSYNTKLENAKCFSNFSNDLPLVTLSLQISSSGNAEIRNVTSCCLDVLAHTYTFENFKIPF